MHVAGSVPNGRSRSRSMRGPCHLEQISILQSFSHTHTAQSTAMVIPNDPKTGQ